MGLSDLTLHDATVLPIRVTSDLFNDTVRLQCLFLACLEPSRTLLDHDPVQQYVLYCSLKQCLHDLRQ